MANEFKIKTGLLLGPSPTQPVISIQNASTSITTDASSFLVTGKAIYDFVDSLKYLSDVSLGLDFYWQAGLLEVSIGTILSLGKNLTLDISGNIVVVNSPNFSGDVSIQRNLFVDQKIELKNFTLANALTGDLWWQSPRLFFKDGSTNRDILQGSLKGTNYPSSPSEGDLYHRIDQGILFVYDSSRAKYLSIFRTTLEAGRSTVVAGSDVYLRVGDATQSSIAGFRMFRNGTITAVSVHNNNTLTTSRNIEVRVNNSAVNKVTLNIPNGSVGAHLSNGNQDFSAEDLIQIVAIANAFGSALNNVIVVVEIAWRV